MSTYRKLCSVCNTREAGLHLKTPTGEVSTCDSIACIELAETRSYLPLRTLNECMDSAVADASRALGEYLDGLGTYDFSALDKEQRRAGVKKSIEAYFTSLKAAIASFKAPF